MMFLNSDIHLIIQIHVSILTSVSFKKFLLFFQNFESISSLLGVFSIFLSILRLAHLSNCSSTSELRTWYFNMSTSFLPNKTGSLVTIHCFKLSNSVHNRRKRFNWLSLSTSQHRTLYNMSTGFLPNKTGSIVTMHCFKLSKSVNNRRKRFNALMFSIYLDTEVSTLQLT